MRDQILMKKQATRRDAGKKYELIGFLMMAVGIVLFVAKSGPYAPLLLFGLIAFVTGRLK
jgi:hypothetical protein